MKKFIILIPLFNDWKSVSKLLNEIDLQIINWDAEISVIIVNDASTEKRSNLESKFKKIRSVKYICKNEAFDRVIIMDADGEDRPEELNDFFEKATKSPNMTITGNRFKRSEGIIFKILYEVHKILTFVFTGKLIKFGNFSCLPRDHVEKLIQKAYLWNSYSSSVVQTIKDRTSIPSTRGKRYVLPSKMNFSALIFHSLAIISVFRKEVIIRSTIFFLIYLFFIFNKISILSLLPVLFLLAFVFVILNISKRSNFEELNKSLDNIDTIDVL